MVYIHEGKPLVFGPANPDEINTACDGQRIFVRILSEEEYRVSLPRFENLHI